MQRRRALAVLALLGLLVTLGAVVRLWVPGPRSAQDAPPPDAVVRSVTVTGAGVGTWPAYDAHVPRFAIATSEETGGSVSVTATSADPDARLTVDGEPATSGEPVAVTGLAAGDELDVVITDAEGTTDQSFVYLPAGFPYLHAESSPPGPTPGGTYLVLLNYVSGTSYETVVDEHGVPAYVRERYRGQDFKPAPHGRFTLARPAADDGFAVDLLGSDYQHLRTLRLRPVPGLGIGPENTDFHDTEVTGDGRVVLVGTRNRTTPAGRTWLDAVLQVIDRRGRPAFTWTSDRAVRPAEAVVLGAHGTDYAHLNSVQLQANDDVVASFRNLDQVLRIATRAHGRYAPGDVVWRLGGSRSDFRFVDDPAGGFCAQHAARILPDGHLLLFDNGSRPDPEDPLAGQTGALCPDPADPDGPRIARPQTRVVEYALDRDAGTATLVWSHEVPGRYAAFAGNADRLPGGRTLVGWWRAREADGSAAPIVTEVTRDGTEVWSLTAEGWFSYRAHHGPLP